MASPEPAAPATPPGDLADLNRQDGTPGQTVASAESHFSTGNSQLAQGKLREAERCYRRTLALDPDHAGAHNNLANALKDQGRLGEAIRCYERALALSNRQGATLGSDMVNCNLGNALRDHGRSDEAAQAYWRAVAIKPDNAPAYNALAALFWALGRSSDAAAYFRRALELASDRHFARSNLLLCLQYNPETTPGELLVEHRAYGASLAPFPAAGAHSNSPVPDRRLNIGYVSPDLHEHPVGFFLMPVFGAHNREQFAIHCYYGNHSEGGINAFLKSRADVWRSTVGIGDEALAAMIRADGIDILVDLAGHTKGNRLPVFARRPAPVQATWAGYVGTTGLEAIDYLITDRWQNPPGSERYAVEKLVRLPDGYVCWAIPGHAPDVGTLPATAPGAVTFGCFNNLAKINSPVIALWARLLRELPRSRLVLKSRALGDRAVRNRLLGLFAAEEVGASRIVLEGQSPHPKLLQRYNDIDIALDPFPYSGGVTTIEALWMGVPVVTLGGERFASRHSLSHLNNVGLAELVAHDPQAYLRIAVELARDLPRLAALRAGLRERLRASPLLQAPRFTAGLEQAYRTMWRQWCKRTG